MLQFNFKIVHIFASVNTAADFLRRWELKVVEKICLKIREDVQTTPIEVRTTSLHVTDEQQFLFSQIDGKDLTKPLTHERKIQSRKKATEWAAI